MVTQRAAAQSPIRFLNVLVSNAKGKVRSQTREDALCQPDQDHGIDGTNRFWNAGAGPNADNTDYEQESDYKSTEEVAPFKNNRSNGGSLDRDKQGRGVWQQESAQDDNRAFRRRSYSWRRIVCIRRIRGDGRSNHRHSRHNNPR
jgi:hypothetical protein